MANDRNLLAVLIDADNISARYADDILLEVKKFGEPALRRVYGDWPSPYLENWKKAVVEFGLEAKQETANTKSKNASDIGMVIDAMDILHEGRFDGFVLVSSDSDFTALANRLRTGGVEVIGVGESKVPVSLRNVCNRFILIENIVSDDEKPAEKEKSVKTGEAAFKHPPSKAVPLILEAMKAMDSETEWYTLSGLGSYVTRAHPDFDIRTYGSAKFKDLLATTGQFDLKKTENGHFMARRRNNPRNGP